MKTMKFLAVLALLSFSMNTMAQNAMQAKLKETKAALKEKASKDAKDEAKRMKKEGWTVSPGALPLEKQIDRYYAYIEQTDDELNPLYYTGEGRATAENYAAAHMQATELARLNLASSIGTEATGIIDNMIANKMLADDQAASITTYISENKTIFSQKLGRVQTPLVATRQLKNKNKEVMIRMVAKVSSVHEIAKDAIRSQLETEGKAYFGKD